MGTVTPEWLAGFFDGEGTVDIRLRRTHGGKYLRFELRAQIVQRDRTPLELVKAIYGGSISGGRVSSWVVTGAAALTFLRSIAPHSICKADQIAVAIQFQERVENPAERMANSGKRGFDRLSQAEINARLALHRKLREIRDVSGLRPKARNYSVQAEAAVYAVPRDGQAVARDRSAQARGENRGLH